MVLNCLNYFICFLILFHPLLQQTFFGGYLLAFFFLICFVDGDRNRIINTSAVEVILDYLLLNISICVDVASLLHQKLNHFLVLQEARRDKTQSAGVNKGHPQDSSLHSSK